MRAPLSITPFCGWRLCIMGWGEGWLEAGEKAKTRQRAGKARGGFDDFSRK